ncbi:putative nucleotidyltransferase substrate binding domain-containing protein [Abyssibacter profundi]|uniref:Cyclic nucleotide-binding protein n=1 Tax=Abyssibacter profundi TaxID=2182787 RepID=A0A383XQ47_9GAMM|nr:putative nucleotidyltransferase substrate binding domain-containing protein [Abyssibacter profundi]PWN54751.1 cyclic nucleotide-binding protein [Abyssibacter profundi]
MPGADASTRVRAGRGALQTIDNALGFLAQHPPYDQIDPGLLREALQHAELAYYAEGRAIIGPDAGVPGFFCIVQQGLIRGTRQDDVRGAAPLFEAGPGETFLAAALYQQRPTRTVHIAAEDSFVIQLPRSEFHTLLESSERFRQYCERRASVLVDRAREQLRTEISAEMQRAATLDTPLGRMSLRAPVSCEGDTTVRAAVRKMHEAGVGSIVISDGGQPPSGIFTLRDLRALIADEACDLDAPVRAAMTANPRGAQASDTVFDAAAMMLEHRIGHLLVTDQNRLLGVVSQRDLFAQQHVDMVSLARSLSGCDSVAAIAEVRQHTQRVINAMLAHGASGRQLTRLLSQLNDVAVRRVLELVEAGHPDALPRYTWLAFGSEARGEQALLTDQDNGLLFEPVPGEPVDATRQRLLSFAQSANEQLAAIGFPLCAGNIMASNPALCLSRQEWTRHYETLIDVQSPEALLQGSIHFDVRPLHGHRPALDPVLSRALAAVETNTQFQHALAQIALGFRPALGLIRSFATRRVGSGRRLDLKKNGLQSFVAATRTLALAHGLGMANTDDRLEALAEAGAIDARDAAAWSEAFSFIQVLRMRAHQQQLEAGEALSNEIDPDSLNPLDRRILKEALRQAQRLHDRLKLNYP